MHSNTVLILYLPVNQIKPIPKFLSFLIFHKFNYCRDNRKNERTIQYSKRTDECSGCVKRKNSRRIIRDFRFEFQILKFVIRDWKFNMKK